MLLAGTVAVLASGIVSIACRNGGPAPPTVPAGPAVSPRIILLDALDLTGWSEKALGSRRPVRYTAIREEGRAWVRAESEDAASMWLRPIRFQPRDHPIVEWEWRVIRPPAAEDLTRKSGNDCCARVLFGFQGDWSQAGYFERRAVEEEVKATGREPPGTSLVYVWSLLEPVDRILDDAHVGARARVVVATSGTAAEGRRPVRRNLRDDYQRAFGAEPPPVVSVALLTDSDDTHGAATADYGSITARKE